MTNDEKLMAQALEALKNLTRNAELQGDKFPEGNGWHALADAGENAITALRDRLAKTDGFACHCDLDPGQQPDGCVFDTGRTVDCMYAEKLAKESKGRNDCEYWQPIKWEEK